MKNKFDSEPESRGPVWKPTRRAALQGGLAGAAALGLSSTARALTPSVDPPEYRRWLIERTTFGWTEDMDQELCTRGWFNYLQWQFDWKTIDDSEAIGVIDAFAPNWDMSPYDANQYMATVTNQGFTEGATWAASIQTIMGWRSKRQLLWVMTDFWSNFFNRFVGMEYQHPAWQAYEHETFYSQATGEALGSFPALLEKSAKGASMLFYLNLYTNKKGKVNENYARELLELHTVGLDPHPAESAFTEPEVVKVAEILTGWRINLPTDTPAEDLGKFYFDKDDYEFDFDNRLVLGKSFQHDATLSPLPTSADGLAMGESLLAHLAGRQSTARHVVRRLAEWLIGDDCPQAILAKAETAFLAPGATIPDVLVKLLEPDSFYLATQANTQSYRRPLNLVTAFCRVAQPDSSLTSSQTGPNGEIIDFPLLTLLEKLGQRPGFKPSPDGYPGENTPWYGAIQPRIEVVNRLAHKDNLGLKVNVPSLLNIFGPPSSNPVSGYAQRVNEVVAGGLLPPSEVVAIQRKLNKWDRGAGLPWPAGTISVEDLAREALALVFSSPSMQFIA